MCGIGAKPRTSKCSVKFPIGKPIFFSVQLIFNSLQTLSLGIPYTRPRPLFKYGSTYEKKRRIVKTNMYFERCNICLFPFMDIQHLKVMSVRQKALVPLCIWTRKRVTEGKRYFRDEFATASCAPLSLQLFLV